MDNECAKCGRTIVKRDATKILVQSGTYGTPKTLCWLCDRCLPSLLDDLEVSMPEDQPRPYTPAPWCRKCSSTVGKKAVFCPYCGDELASQKTRRSKP